MESERQHRAPWVAVILCVGALFAAGCTAPASPPSPVRTGPVPTQFPTPSTTGVPAGTALTEQPGDLVVNHDGLVIDAMHITGSLIIRASGVVVTRSQIDDSVWNEGDGSFTISDSTVGTVPTPGACPTTSQPMGVGFQNYTATRVQVRGHEDGFRGAGPGVTIRDSFYLGCAYGDTPHADGVQDYPAAPGIIVDHNTFDMGVLTDGYTSPIFVHAPGTVGATITDNLAIGGTYSVNLSGAAGSWTVTGNRVVDRSWDYGPYTVDTGCTGVTWRDNTVVSVDNSYDVTTTVRTDTSCP